MPYSLTTALVAWLRKFGTPLQRKEVAFFISGYLDAWTMRPPKEPPAEIGRQLGLLVDAFCETDVLEQQRVITCRVGCAHCCKQAVRISSVEADRLAHYAEAHFIPIDTDQLRQQARFTPDEWIHASEPARRCVFLGESNQCRVYEARPLACRKYFSVGDPEDCNLDTHPQGQFRQWVSVSAEVLTSAAYTQWGTGFLSTMLLAALDRRRAQHQEVTQ